MSLNDDNNASQHRIRYSDVAEEHGKMLEPIQGFEKTPLVSIDDAVKPLVNHVHDIQGYLSKAKDKYKEKPPPPDGLSMDESVSIRIYTMEWKPRDKSLYVVLNNTLRMEDREQLKKWFRYLKLLITALAKLPSTPRVVFRGIKLNFSSKHPKGAKPIWWGFSSCTDSVEILKSESFFGKTGVRTLFSIDCYSGKDIRQHSAYPTENELLLLPARQFQVVAVLDVGNDVYIIQLKEIQPDFPLIEDVSVANAPLPTPISPQHIVLSPVITSEPTSSSFTDDQNYRNLNLERDLTRIQPRANANLGGQRLTDRDMRIVVDLAIVDKRCEKLSLENNKMTSKGMSTLAAGIRESTTLKELDLSNNHLSGEELFSLAKELSVNRTTIVVLSTVCGMAKVNEMDTPPITILNLSKNRIGDKGAIYLADVIRFKRALIQLNLSDNQITDKGVESLANALSHPNANLETLDLQNNRLINNSSVKHLLDMISQSRSLNTLRLNDCDFNNESRQKLRNAANLKGNSFQLIIEPSN